MYTVEIKFVLFCSVYCIGRKKRNIEIFDKLIRSSVLIFEIYTTVLFSNKIHNVSSTKYIRIVLGYNTTLR